MTVPHGPSGIVQILAVESPDLASSNNNTSQSQHTDKQHTW
jgi:hypothetical protein